MHNIHEAHYKKIGLIIYTNYIILFKKFDVSEIFPVCEIK